MLYSTKEIAEMFGISEYSVTHNWCSKGLKHIRMKGTFMFKIDWINEFIEEEAEKNAAKKINNASKKHKTNSFKIPKFNNEMKIV